MTNPELRPADLVVRPPLHPTLMWVPATCFVGGLLTDLAYYKTAEMQWANFSAWLITAGVILGWLSCILGIVDLVGRRYATAPVPGWAYAIGIGIVMILATFNMLIHTRDAWTSVVPWGLTLSAITVAVLVFTTVIGWTALYRRNVMVIA
ncbi:MAG: DUF2231 domain-containing protein [Dongia sp.]|jgi:uncharacterized membrane protein